MREGGGVLGLGRRRLPLPSLAAAAPLHLRACFTPPPDHPPSGVQAVQVVPGWRAPRHTHSHQHGVGLLWQQPAAAHAGGPGAGRGQRLRQGWVARVCLWLCA